MDKCKPINHFVEENILYINPHMPYVEKKKQKEREWTEKIQICQRFAVEST